MAVATANFQSTLDVNALLEGASRLPQDDFEQFFNTLKRLAAQRQPHELPDREAELIHQIKYGLPLSVLKRSKYLSDKAEWETVTDEEYQELKTLIPQIDEFAVVRLECMMELAKLRGVTVKEIMKELNVKPR